jgi:hypothetical protein
LTALARGDAAARQLRILRDVKSGPVEMKLLTSSDRLAYFNTLAKTLLVCQRLESTSDPLNLFFAHSPTAKVFTVGQAPEPESDDYSTNASGTQLIHFANTEQYLVHAGTIYPSVES